MAWTVELDSAVEKELNTLDPQQAKRSYSLSGLSASTVPLLPIPCMIANRACGPADG